MLSVLANAKVDGNASTTTTCASAVIVIDMLAERLDIAADFGAPHCIDAAGIPTEELTEQVRRQPTAPAPTGCSRLSVCRGVIPDGVRFLNNGGTLLKVGNVGMGRTFNLDPSVPVYGNKTVRGVMLYDPITLATGLSFLQNTHFPFDRLLPKPFPLAEINAAFESALAGSVPRGALVP